MKTKFTLAALLTTLCAGAAHATLPQEGVPQPQTMQLKYHHTVAGIATQLQLPLAGTATYVAGNYSFETQTPAGSFLGYCVDPFQWASPSFHAYEAMPLADHLAQPLLTRVDMLFGHAYGGSLLNATKAAGFQLALWEVFNDDGNLSAGAVRKTARTNGNVASEAQSLLDALPGWTTGTGYTAYDLMFYENATYQDYISVAGLAPVVVPAIPEPENYALMLAGLGLLGWSASRRKQGR